MIKFKAAFERFKHSENKEARLVFTRPQMDLFRQVYRMQCDDSFFDRIDTAFFRYKKLDEEMCDAMAEYILCGVDDGPDLQNEIDAERLMPFAALNADGSALSYGSNEFKNVRSWGVLCFDLERGEGDDCPVLWVLRGNARPWAERASALAVSLVKRAK